MPTPVLLALRLLIKTRYKERFQFKRGVYLSRRPREIPGLSSVDKTSVRKRREALHEVGVARILGGFTWAKSAVPNEKTPRLGEDIQDRWGGGTRRVDRMDDAHTLGGPPNRPKYFAPCKPSLQQDLDATWYLARW